MILDIKGTIIAKTATDDVEKVRMSIREGLSYGNTRISVNPSGDILLSGYLGWPIMFITDGRITINPGSQKRVIVKYHLTSWLADFAFIFVMILVLVFASRMSIKLMIALPVIVLCLSIFGLYQTKKRLESIIRRQIAKVN